MDGVTVNVVCDAPMERIGRLASRGPSQGVGAFVFGRAGIGVGPVRVRFREGLSRALLAREKKEVVGHGASDGPLSHMPRECSGGTTETRG